MPVIMISVKTPPGEATKQGEIFSSGKLPKMPDFVKRINTYVWVDKCIRSISLFECPKDKLFEGMKAMNQRLTAYFGIEGISFKVNPLMEIKDALSLVGL